MYWKPSRLLHLELLSCLIRGGTARCHWWWIRAPLSSLGRPCWFCITDAAGSAAISSARCSALCLTHTSLTTSAASLTHLWATESKGDCKGGNERESETKLKTYSFKCQECLACKDIVWTFSLEITKSWKPSYKPCCCQCSKMFVFLTNFFSQILTASIFELCSIEIFSLNRQICFLLLKKMRASDNT